VRIIGVIDLKDGLAVHARRGQRDTYAPVREAGGAAIDGDAVKLAQSRQAGPSTTSFAR
jgi:uncharacterized protein related to proFAR isomerase